MSLNPITKAKYGLTDGSIPHVHLTSKKILATITFAMPRHSLNLHSKTLNIAVVSAWNPIEWKRFKLLILDFSLYSGISNIGT